jgi:hypothetical protein
MASACGRGTGAAKTSEGERMRTRTSHARPARQVRAGGLAALLPAAPVLLILLALAVLGRPAPSRAEEPAGQRYRSETQAFSITLPAGWEVRENPSPDALASVSARDGTGGGLNVNVTRQGEDISAIDGFIACEQITELVAAKLGGYRIRCSQVRIAGKAGQNVLYFRKVGSAGPLAYQFVSQTVTTYRGRRYTVTAYASGPGEEAALDGYRRLAPALQRSVSTFALH